MNRGLCLILAVLSACSLTPSDGHRPFTTQSPEIMTRSDGHRLASSSQRQPGSEGYQAATDDSFSSKNEHRRFSRSAGLSLKPQPEGETKPGSRADLSLLLAKIISAKKGAARRNSGVNNRVNTVSHRLRDRDYVGWMDFGRRSAEEYEYSS